jgi:hypothetical protein
VRAVAVGLLIEEQRSEIAAAWRGAVERELGGEPAIGFAVGPLLREMALALRGDVPPSRMRSGEDALQRCAVLVRSGAQGARVAREFKLLHRAVWDTLRAAGRIVAADERRAVDEWLTRPWLRASTGSSACVPGWAPGARTDGPGGASGARHGAASSATADGAAASRCAASAPWCPRRAAERREDGSRRNRLIRAARLP